MIVLYVLTTCPYCNRALELLKEYKIKHKAIIVEPEEKEYYKKQNRMNTFPQIFMQLDINNFMKIGGASDLEESINQANSIKNSDVSLDSVYYMYKSMYRK